MDHPSHLTMDAFLLVSPYLHDAREMFLLFVESCVFLLVGTEFMTPATGEGGFRVLAREGFFEVDRSLLYQTRVAFYAEANSAPLPFVKALFC